MDDSSSSTMSTRELSALSQIESSPIAVFVRRHAELFFVVFILVVVGTVFHWVPYKLAFLNFFFLPVLAAGYLLGMRQAILSTLMCVLLVFIYFGWAWAVDALTGGHVLDAPVWIARNHGEMVFSLAVWAGFLTITGTAFARVHHTMLDSHRRAHELNQQLQRQGEVLRDSNATLQASSAELQKKTEEIQEKSLLVEKLKQQTEQTLYTTMDSTVARLMVQNRLRQEKRDISVLMCDLKNFTTFSEDRRPEVILEELNGFYGVVERVIEDFHGHIDRFIGDGIMCEFGAPVDYQRNSLQAVVAALKIQQRFKDLKSNWGLRIGIASGEAIVGLVGSRRRSYTAIGEVVNLAGRLEQLCEPGCLYVDETAYEAVRSFVEVELVRSLVGRRDEDLQSDNLITAKERELAQDPENAELLYEVGMLYLQQREATTALRFFRRALEQKPGDDRIKVAFADASMKREEYEKAAGRGASRRKAVYKVLGLANPLLNRLRFPAALYEKYKHVEQLIEIPEDVVLCTEVIDGSVGHSLAVAFIAYALADRLGLPEPVKNDLLIAGRLQDIGKATLWHQTLNRRGGLSDQERKDLEGHVQASVSMARKMGFDRMGYLDMIAMHHELMDGSGFPNHLKGEEIPLAARISCVADVYSALTAWRPYRPAWDTQIALSEVRKGAEAGKYDPQVVEALCQLMA